MLGLGGLTNGTGVQGIGFGTGPGVSGTGGSGGGVRVVGASGSGNGIGVLAENTAGGIALQATGPAVFSRSGS